MLIFFLPSEQRQHIKFPRNLIELKLLGATLLAYRGCSAVGASCCYLIFRFLGRQTILKFFPEQIAACQRLMGRFSNMMGFTIFLFRLSPIVPNWLVNISSPLLGVPLVDFFMGTFIVMVQLQTGDRKQGGRPPRLLTRMSRDRWSPLVLKMFNCVVENSHPKAHQFEIDVSNPYIKASSLYRCCTAVFVLRQGRNNAPGIDRCWCYFCGLSLYSCVICCDLYRADFFSESDQKLFVE
ncbi:hypothetical protein ACTXT7_015003, partial [Hymenolepis weldensis]